MKNARQNTCPLPASPASWNGPGTTPLFWLVLLGLSCFLPGAAAETSEPAPLAAHALLLDIARAGDKLVAVGDHGDVVISADNGRRWTQSLAPTRALLTGVSFVNARQGWAVGHDGVILATDDGGLTWRRQDAGTGSGTVFLSVLFRDPLRGYAVGAYGKYFATADGGKTWSPGHPLADEVHYNRISGGPDGSLYLAGESGTALRSRDDGRTWERLEVPYDGSLFGILPLPGGPLIAYGLRGHILRSEDQGKTWAPLDSGSSALIMGGLVLRNGVVLLAGQGGSFFLSRDAGHHFALWKPADGEMSVADLAETADGAVIAVGDAGARRINLPQP
jgi:photosystem II stability/assembly factor-like uncharacterized protein